MMHKIEDDAVDGKFELEQDIIADIVEGNVP